MTTLYDIMISFVGEPSNDLEQFLLYLSAVCLSVALFYSVIYLFKLIGGYFQKNL